MTEIKNAVITSTQLTIADHGYLSAWIMVDYGGSGQGFGGYNLGSVYKGYDSSAGNAAALFIIRCCKVCGVMRWEDLKGQPIRVEADHNGIRAIGNFIEDDWFYPAQAFAS